MDLTNLMQDVVAGIGSPVHLSLPPNLSRFLWHDRSLETLIERFIHWASTISHAAGPVRIAVRQKAKMQDLEKFFGIPSCHWIQLRIQWRGLAGFDGDARRILEDLGYRCEEWVGVEDSPQQLGAFYLGTDKEPKLVFWTDSRRDSHKCDLLIPVARFSAVIQQ
jgi:hypothetical protein